MLRTRRVLTAAIVTVVLAIGGCFAHSALGSSWMSDPNGKVLYLTFDDGPGDETVEILDLVREYDAKAVFFALGDNLAHDADVARRIVAEGHVLANHTWNHRNLTDLDDAGWEREVGETASLLGQLGSASRCVRPPYGATDDDVAANLAAADMTEVLWNVDTQDWAAPGVEVIVDRLLQASSGDVVLMHDGGGDRTQTVQALREALPKLAEQGFTFEIVPDCLQM